ncbi:MAG: hypothetical protein LBE56_00940 [Tannerella sp.]|jgi:hypothetical protein|nr:hypothetical protein [Tannerella sp.]
MDTDELSNETYKAVIFTAEKFNHDLSLHFGCLARECDNEEEYLSKAEELIEECLEDDNIKVLMDDLFFENPPKEKVFRKVLSETQYNINEVKEIPIEKRTFEF